MKTIGDLIPAAVDRGNLTQSGAQSSTAPTFSAEESALIKWFYATVRTAFGVGKFDTQFGNDEDVRYSMRFFGPRIIRHDRVELRQKIDAAVSRLSFPNIAEILDVEELQEWETRIHRPFVPAGPLLEDKTTKDRKLEERKAALAKMRKELGI